MVFFMLRSTLVSIPKFTATCVSDQYQCQLTGPAEWCMNLEQAHLIIVQQQSPPSLTRVVLRDVNVPNSFRGCMKRTKEHE